MQTHYIIIPHRGAEIPITKGCAGDKNCLVEPESPQLCCTIRYIASWNMELTPSRNRWSIEARLELLTPNLVFYPKLCG
jgi:hypothetical protein